MSRTAYCVVHLDTKSFPPKVLGADIYSEPASSLTGAIRPGHYAFDVVDVGGEEFEDAKTKLLAILAEEPYRQVYGWVLALLEANSR